MSSSNTFLNALPSSVGAIFDEIQGSPAGHSRNSAALYKLHLRAYTNSHQEPLRDVTPFSNSSNISTNRKSRKKTPPLVSPGEARFNGIFIEMVFRVLLARQSVTASAMTRTQSRCEDCANRIVAFVGLYAKHLKRKETTTAKPRTDVKIYSRFVGSMLTQLVDSLHANDSIIRARAIAFVQSLVESISNEERDLEEICTTLLNALVQRLHDKDVAIRKSAIDCLCCLHQKFESACTVVPRELSGCLSRDPSIQVRHQILAFFLKLLPQDINDENFLFNIILGRSRDEDPSIRILVLSTLMSPLGHHILNLEPKTRISIVDNGLQDPDTGVIRASRAMICHAFSASFDGTKSLLDSVGNFALAFSNHSFKDVSSEVLRVLYDDGRVWPILPNAEDIEFWTTLTRKHTLVIKTMVEHSFNIQDQMATLLEKACFPSLVTFAAFLQDQYDTLMLSYFDQELAREEMEDKAVVLQDLLDVGAMLDFGDELGRRRVFSVCSEMLVHPYLPTQALDSCLALLQVVMGNERDFVRFVVESIVELRDTMYDDIATLAGSQSSNGSRTTSRRRSLSTTTSATTNLSEKSFRHTKTREEMSKEEMVEADEKDLRSLEICRGMLKQIKGIGLGSWNEVLDGMLADLIVPSVRMTCVVEEHNIRERIKEVAVEVVGLMCLLNVDLAKSTVPLFVNQFYANDSSVRMKDSALRSLADIAVVWWGNWREDEHTIVKTVLCDPEVSGEIGLLGIWKILLWYGDSAGLLDYVLDASGVELDEFVKQYLWRKPRRVYDFVHRLVPIILKHSQGSVRLCHVVVCGLKSFEHEKVELCLDVLKALKDRSMSKIVRSTLCDHVLDKISFSTLREDEREALVDAAKMVRLTSEHFASYQVPVTSSGP
ncbi:armadillo-type protein [Flagelloscypha sp. PMI_526]|nr:armadillo-type protein [Flagelloscypha sp. PMI_526]